MKAAQIDFHAVVPEHHAIDARLRNWGAWCNSAGAPSTSPMFRMCPPPTRVRRDLLDLPNTVDTMDAHRMASAVTGLPDKQRAALNWCYVKPVSPRRACENIGVSMEGLASLVREGRQMLLNREAERSTPATTVRKTLVSA